MWLLRPLRVRVQHAAVSVARHARACDHAPMTDAEPMPITLLSTWRSGQRCPRRVDGKPKRSIWRREPSTVDTILVHATAVRGGFGVATAQLAAVTQAQLDAVGHGLTPDAAVYTAALAARFARTTYHGVYMPRIRTSLVQWPAMDRTYHGDAANSCSMGWAYDGSFRPGLLDDLDIEAARESLRHLIRDALEQGCPLRRVSPHANHSTKQHDPGPLVWREVIVPVAEQLGLELALDWTTGEGQPWARRWMEAD